MYFVVASVRSGERSLHAQGRPLGQSPICSTGRNIPAMAGKTNFLKKERPSVGKDPRVGGEALLFSTPREALEQSLHTRGRPGRQGRSFEVQGKIPARAGKTVKADFCLLAFGKIPARGEDPILLEYDRELQEQSPLARGRLRRQWPTTEIVGTIPALAGKTYLATSASMNLEKYPCACREDRPSKLSLLRAIEQFRHARKRPPS